jgi:enoyl-CoA hydratase
MATQATAPAAGDTPSPALEFENVLYEKEEGIAYVTFNRPAVLNALNGPTLADLRAALEDARDDTSVHGVILTGAGDKAFAAGADIVQLARATAVEAEQSSRSTQATFALLENLGKPVIAAINGFALGGGCEAALACTIRIATPHSRFGQPEVKLGVLPGGGGTQRLPRLVGKGRALQLMLTGGMIDAEEAWRIGLVNEIVPAESLIPRAEAILQEIAANAPLAVRYAIQAVNSESQSDGIVLEASYFGLLAGTEDKTEGTSAFLQKRAPRFRGR